MYCCLRVCVIYKKKMFQQYRKTSLLKCTAIVFILLIISLYLLFRLEYISNNSAFQRTILFFSSEEPSVRSCPVPARFHVSAEPELYRKWSADAYLLAGGSNLFPGRAAFHPVLIGNCCRDSIFRYKSNRTAGLAPIVNRTFADVSYRSSYCQDRREDLVGIIRQRVEAAGFTFKATGLCGGTGYPEKANFTGRGEWTRCGQECKHSKIMLSFERFQPGHHYLSEKLFTPLEYGAVPAYFGNGHSILDMLTANRKAFIDRIEFQSDEAFADKIVDLLRHPSELQKMQEEQVFHDVEMAKKRVLFISQLAHATEEGNPELYHALRQNEKFKRFINGTKVKIRSSGVNNVNVIKHVLNLSSVDYVRDSRTCADIEVHGCCFRR